MKLETISKVQESDNVENTNKLLSQGWMLIMKPIKIRSLDNEKLVYVLGNSNL